MLNAKQNITDITACRGLFALWVFAYHADLHAQFAHYLWRASNLFQHGYLGVDGFFLLSGMILARVYPQFGTSLTGTFRFWGRRMARIYPVHLATIGIIGILVIAGLAAGIQPNDPSRFSIPSLLQNLLLMQGWGFGPHWAWNYPSWSVSTEWAGYLLFPVLMVLVGRCPLIVRGQFSILCFPCLGLLAYRSFHGLNVTYTDALTRFFIEFIWGLTSVQIVPYFADAMPTAKVTIAGLVVIIIGLFIGFDTFTVFGIWLVLISLIMHADAERKPLLARPRFLHFLGRISYSFYMSFAIAELLLAQLFRHAGMDPAAEKLVYCAAMTVVTFGISVLLHFFVETPSRRRIDHWLREIPPPEILPPRNTNQLGRITPQKMQVPK